jgi:uncharacterized protein YcsI (UPF0317 family)
MSTTFNILNILILPSKYHSKDYDMYVATTLDKHSCPLFGIAIWNRYHHVRLNLIVLVCHLTYEFVAFRQVR